MIVIDTESREPLVDQLCRSIRQAIASGELEPGATLPSARQLGADLDIHWNTVSRAYRQLADEGLVFVAHGRKAKVINPGNVKRTPSPADLAALAKAFRDALTNAKLAGIDEPSARALFCKEMDECQL
ncbi:GntR family transcriptional regulator [Marinihelvus fidelis]|uniref:GntR family transcriptional regulator n=1 Tax=Marinihelvus fidelis TaxID=2613842 RepID=A0A5N0T7S5_9GAMM|nr:GntR family transcriptional regulator [Marinihelvus fidelis]KAA9130197.1 GntR family transcriptional regulator [Marinihelvus fidelis]